MASLIRSSINYALLTSRTFVGSRSAAPTDQERRIVSLLLLILVGATSLLVFDARAAAALFHWESINVDIEVKADGDMWVTETQKYVFSASDAGKRRRWIPLKNMDGIDQVTVSENERILPSTTRVEKEHLWHLWKKHLSIEWSHDVHPPEARTFVLRYRVVGGLRFHDETGICGGPLKWISRYSCVPGPVIKGLETDYDQVYWNAIFSERLATIQSAKVTVRLPELPDVSVLAVRSYGAPGTYQIVDLSTVEFNPRGPLAPDDGLTVQVAFPHGVLSANVPQWQKSDQIGSALLAGFCSIFFVIGPIVRWIYGAHLKRKYKDALGRDPKREDVGTWHWLIMSTGGGDGGDGGDGGGGGE